MQISIIPRPVAAVCRATRCAYEKLRRRNLSTMLLRSRRSPVARPATARCLALGLLAAAALCAHLACNRAAGRLLAEAEATASARCGRLPPVIEEVRRQPPDCMPVVYEGRSHRHSDSCTLLPRYLPVLADEPLNGVCEEVRTAGRSLKRQQAVPKLLHILAAPRTASVVKNFLRHNAGWRCIRWSREQLEQLGREFYPELLTQAAWADKLPFLPLYKFGGLRLSPRLEFESERPLEPLLLGASPRSHAISAGVATTGPLKRVSAGAVFAAAGHPMLLTLLSSDPLLRNSTSALLESQNPEDAVLELALRLYENLQPQVRDPGNTVLMLSDDVFPLTSAHPSLCGQLTGVRNPRLRSLCQKLGFENGTSNVLVRFRRAGVDDGESSLSFADNCESPRRLLSEAMRLSWEFKYLSFI